MKVISSLSLSATKPGLFFMVKPATSTASATSGPRLRSVVKLSAAARLVARVAMMPVSVMETTRRNA
jgi:hypothetical protein